MREKREKIKWVRLNEVEDKMAKELVEKLGFTSFMELVRYLIRREWEKVKEGKYEEKHSA